MNTLIPATTSAQSVRRIYTFACYAANMTRRLQMPVARIVLTISWIKTKQISANILNHAPQAHIPSEDKAGLEAKAKLAELFGDATPEQDAGQSTASPSSEAEKALAELKRLFDDE